MKRTMKRPLSLLLCILLVVSVLPLTAWAADVQEDDLPDDEHNYIVVETIPSTCTEYGQMIYRCEDCGDSYAQILPLAQHSFGAWTVIVEPTEKESGLQEHTCSVCGYTEQQTILEEGVEGLLYEIKNGEATVAGYNGEVPETLVIPEQFGGRPVTAIGDRVFESCRTLQKI